MTQQNDECRAKFEAWARQNCTVVRPDAFLTKEQENAAKNLRTGFNAGYQAAYNHNKALRDAIIVLPDGAEPQPDDLIVWSGNIGQAINDDRSEDGYLIRMLAQINGYDPHNKKHIIIQRNGKPVIYQSALLTTEQGEEDER